MRRECGAAAADNADLVLKVWCTLPRACAPHNAVMRPFVRAQLKAEREQVAVLERNISCLYRTARDEIARMRERITALDAQCVASRAERAPPAFHAPLSRHERDARASGDAAAREAQLRRRIAELEHAQSRDQ